MRFRTIFVATVFAFASSQVLAVSNIPAKKIQGRSCVLEAVKPTSLLKMNINLDSTQAVLANVFNPYDPSSYNFVIENDIYDSLGTQHDLRVYFVKEAAGSWKAYIFADGSVVQTGNLKFGTDGRMISSTDLSDITFEPNTGADPQKFSIDMTCSTQFGNPNEVHDMWQDGHGAGWNFHSLLNKHLNHHSCFAIPPHATTTVKLNLNLSAADIYHVEENENADPDNYNFYTNVDIYDSLGASYKLTLYFAKTIQNNTWNVGAYLYHVRLGGGQIKFDSKGSLVSVTGLDKLSWLPYSGADSPQYFKIDMTCSTQYGGKDKLIEDTWQDGNTGSVN